LLRYDSPWEKGYQIEQVYEAWVYKTEQKGVGDDKGHFTGYVNMFLKIKQESSGWPTWVTHREDGVEHPTVERHQKELEYVTKYRDKEGIDLDVTKIEKKTWLENNRQKLPQWSLG
jgi:hypothetical protein